MLLEDKSKEKMERFQKTNAHFERIGHLIGLQWFGYFLRTMVPVLVAKAHELPYYYFPVGLTLCPILWVIHNPWTVKRVKVELTDKRVGCSTQSMIGPIEHYVCNPLDNKKYIPNLLHSLIILTIFIAILPKKCLNKSVLGLSSLYPTELSEWLALPQKTKA